MPDEFTIEVDRALGCAGLGVELELWRAGQGRWPMPCGQAPRQARQQPAGLAQGGGGQAPCGVPHRGGEGAVEAVGAFSPQLLNSKMRVIKRAE